MKTEFINGFQRNYLKVALTEIGEKRLRYQYQIVTTRKLAGFLPVTLHVSNGESSLYYDITAKQSIPKWLSREKIRKEWIEKFMAGLKTALWSMEQYLLDERNLLLDPDYIFQEVESECFGFIYIPYYQEKGKSGMEKLLSFLVENADEGEPETMGALYEIYADWERMGQELTPEVLIALWEKNTANMREEEKVVVAEEKAEPAEEPKEEATNFFSGWYKRLMAGETRVVMENREYRPQRSQDRAAEKSTEAVADGQTAYMEVQREKEERNLYRNGRENRKVTSLERLPLVIGKKEGKADVVLQDASVSRLHARLTEEDERVYLEDMNATNGTFKNGVRLRPYERVELLREDEVGIGNLRFTYR